MSDSTANRPTYPPSPSIANPYAPPPPPQQHQQQNFMPVAATSYYQYQNGPAPMLDPNFIAFQQQQQQQAYAQQFMMQGAPLQSLHPSQQIYPPFQQPIPNQSPFPHHQQPYHQQQHHMQPSYYNQNHTPLTPSVAPKKKYEFKNKTFVPNKDHSSYLKANKPQTNGHVNNNDDISKGKTNDDSKSNNDTQKQTPQQHSSSQDQQPQYDSSISTPSIDQVSPDHNNTTSHSSPPSTTSTTPKISASNTTNNNSNDTSKNNISHNNSHNNHNNSHSHISIKNDSQESSQNFFKFQIQSVDFKVGKPLFFGTNEASLTSQKKKFRDIDEAKKSKEEAEELAKLESLKIQESKKVEESSKPETSNGELKPKTPVQPQEEFKTPSPEPPKPTVAKWSFIAEKAAKKHSPKSKSASPSVSASPAVKKEERFVPSVSNVLEPLGVVLLRSMFDKGFQRVFINSGKLPSIVPRGLVNTGNICFMSSILQLLLYCQPFYRTLNVISTKTIQSLSGASSSPLIDALIELYKNFNIKLDNEDKQFGDSLVPEQFYKEISKNERFSHLQWGQQEDAEEFFGYLLDGLHEEFISSVKSLKPNEIKTLLDTITSEEIRQLVRQSLKQFSDEDDFKSSNESNGNTITSDDGWHEVGSAKNKVSAKRTVEVKPSPIRQLFGGQFRSILDVPKQRESQSITLDPFQQIQLDISDDSINTLEDAFKNISQIEEIPYKSSNGSDVIAKKQTFIDKLPEVLIVHLKRFSFVSKSQDDNGYKNHGRIEKIRKKISYQMDFQIPQEVISVATRRFNPNLKYKLSGVVYHHGISSEGGHYTVDVLRNETNKWIRFDDTIITELTPEDVISGGDNDGVKTAYILMYEKIN